MAAVQGCEVERSMPNELRSAVIVPLPEAAAAVDEWRERTCDDKPSTGVPAHVTIVFPFVPAARIDDELVASLRALARSTESFPFELSEIRRFPYTLYLAPDPGAPFIRLTEAVVARYPDYPPFGGAFDLIVPHLTIARGDGPLLHEAEASVRPHLPIRCRARGALLLEEVLPDSGGWKTRARLPFASGAPG